ncbi:MAG: SPFH domain-containing protein [Pseudomonadota bacterium]
MKRFLTLIFGALLAAGCTPHGTDSTEVGVRTAKIAIIGEKGVQQDIYAPGSTYFFPPIINDWHVFDTALQNLEMTRERNSGARAGDDSLRFKTVDGNDISVNVTVAWRIDPTRVPYVLQFVGDDIEAVEEKLVRPVSRTVIRDVLNELASEEFYDADSRFKKGADAEARLNYYLNDEGVIIEQVLLGEHAFNPGYEQVIRDKKVAEQDAARLQSETLAAGERVKRDLEEQKGFVSQAIEKAMGESRRKTLEADAAFYEAQRKADAITTEAKAEAAGLKARAAALSGAGGIAQVKLKLAEALAGKPIVFLPASSGMDVRNTDVNALLQRYGVQAASGK